METSDFTIVKRDGSADRFSLDKIMNAIIKAFRSVNEPVSLSNVSKIISRLDLYDGIKVEEIQNLVEEALMREGHYRVAKSFMLYRQRHAEDREVMDELKFLSDYCEATNAATGSKYDANANVEHKNIATLIGELPKSNFIRLNRRLLTDRMKKMYGKELADQYLDLLTHHFIYKNDETSLANYCASITMYPWLTGGTKSIGGNSTAPTNLKSFCGGFVNMVFMVSSMLSGACATPEFLMYLNYFIGLEYGREYYKEPEKVVDLSLKQRTVDKIITDCFEQIVYSINQPTGAQLSGCLLEHFVLRPLLFRKPVRRLLFPRRQQAQLGGAELAAKAVYEMVQPGTHQDGADFSGRDGGSAEQGRRCAGPGVG